MSQCRSSRVHVPRQSAQGRQSKEALMMNSILLRPLLSLGQALMITGHRLLGAFSRSGFITLSLEMRLVFFLRDDKKYNFAKILAGVTLITLVIWACFAMFRPKAFKQSEIGDNVALSPQPGTPGGDGCANDTLLQLQIYRSIKPIRSGYGGMNKVLAILSLNGKCPFAFLGR